MSGLMTIYEGLSKVHKKKTKLKSSVIFSSENK